MRLFADTNVTATAVRALRARGHDVVYSAERAVDPGDSELLAEALAETRVFLTKDHDIGALIFGQSTPHAGVVLLDDLGDPSAEAALLIAVIDAHAAQLGGGAFVRVDASGRVRLGKA